MGPYSLGKAISITSQAAFSSELMREEIMGEKLFQDSNLILNRALHSCMKLPMKQDDTYVYEGKKNL